MEFYKYKSILESHILHTECRDVSLSKIYALVTWASSKLAAEHAIYKAVTLLSLNDYNHINITVFLPGGNLCFEEARNIYYYLR